MSSKLWPPPIRTARRSRNRPHVAKDFPVARGLGPRWDHFTLGAATATGNYKRLPPAASGPAVALADYVAGIPAAAGAKGPCPNDGCASSPWCYMTWPQELSAHEQEFINHGYGAEPTWLTEFGWPGNAQANGVLFPS